MIERTALGPSLYTSLSGQWHIYAANVCSGEAPAVGGTTYKDLYLSRVYFQPPGEATSRSRRPQVERWRYFRFRIGYGSAQELVV